MKDFDKANMLAMFDEALSRIIKYLQEGNNDKARFFALDIRDKFREVIGFLKSDYDKPKRKATS